MNRFKTGKVVVVNCTYCNSLIEKNPRRVYKTNYCNDYCRFEGPRKEALKKPYGRLTVLEDLGVFGPNRLILCQCSCGNKTKVDYSSLTSGHTTSCGCYIRDKLRTNVKNIYKKFYAMDSRWQELQIIAQKSPSLKALLNDLEKQYPL